MSPAAAAAAAVGQALAVAAAAAEQSLAAAVPVASFVEPIRGHRQHTKKQHEKYAEYAKGTQLEMTLWG